MKRATIITLILLLIITASIFTINYFQLQSKMNSVLKDDPRNKGIKVFVHYAAYVNPSILIYDLKSVTSDKAPADVFRVFLQFSEAVKIKKYDKVILSFRGKAKFKISGKYFQVIGEEYDWQNPVYTIRTFPENLKSLDGSRVYDSWSGGVIGVLKEEMHDFNDFHYKWYIDDL